MAVCSASSHTSPGKWPLSTCATSQGRSFRPLPCAILGNAVTRGQGDINIMRIPGLWGLGDMDVRSVGTWTMGTWTLGLQGEQVCEDTVTGTLGPWGPGDTRSVGTGTLRLWGHGDRDTRSM